MEGICAPSSRRCALSCQRPWAEPVKDHKPGGLLKVKPCHLPVQHLLCRRSNIRSESQQPPTRPRRLQAGSLLLAGHLVVNQKFPSPVHMPRQILFLLSFYAGATCKLRDSLRGITLASSISPLQKRHGCISTKLTEVGHCNIGVCFWFLAFAFGDRLALQFMLNLNPPWSLGLPPI